MLFVVLLLQAIASDIYNMFKPADQKLMRICKETGDVEALARLLRRKKLDVNHSDQVKLMMLLFCQNSDQSS